jgi:condensin complex subunit 1
LLSRAVLGGINKQSTADFHPPSKHPTITSTNDKMSDHVEFDINESLKLYLSDAATIPTPEANPELLDCENDPDSLTQALVNNVLDPVADMVADNPEGIMQTSAFDTVQSLLKCATISTSSSLPRD